MLVNKVIKFDDLTSQNSITNNDYVVGVRDDGSGNPVDFKYNASLFAGAGSLKQKITITIAGKDVDDAFFSNTISEIVTLNQSYLEGEDFTQAGTIISFINLDLFVGQVILAKV